MAALLDDAYVGFYRANDISPVRQDVTDLKRHFSRRAHLYRSLGLPPGAVRGASVLEVGPGSGHNALYTALLKPSRYLLVDANPRAIAEASERLAGYLFCDVLFEDIEVLDLDETFDIVLAEGLLPHRKDPSALAQKLSRLVRPGGIMVVTTADYVSVLSETLRRLIRCAVVDPQAPLEQQLVVLRPLFASHLAALPGASRPLDDWLADTLINPWAGKLFSIEDAINALGAVGFEVYGSSPRFLTDWRWYKDVYGEQAQVNDLAVKIYHRNLEVLLDSRIVPEESCAEGILDICRGIFGEMLAAEAKIPNYDHVAQLCQDLAELVEPSTAAALDEAAAFFLTPDEPPRFDVFVSFFGRGQQYLSFIKN